MNLQRHLGSAALVLAATAGCTQPATTSDQGDVLTEAQARGALLTPDLLPVDWQPTEVPARDLGSAGSLASEGTACGRATRRLAEFADRWGSAETGAVAAWANRDMVLKQEVASDPHLETVRLEAPLRGQAAACRDIVLVTSGWAVESRLRICDLDSTGPGVQVVQSWTLSDGSAGSARLAYLFRGHSLVVLTLMSAEPSMACDDATFDGIIEVATARVAAVIR